MPELFRRPSMKRKNRGNDELREIRFTRAYTRYAEGSVLVECGRTRVLCNASVEDRVPSFLKNSGRGWITAEYSMLPRSTHTRVQREAVRGRQQGRGMEIQRLIGRALRSVVDLEALGERSIVLDCDVLQADGGTRVTAINGAFIALQDAVSHLLNDNRLKQSPLHGMVAAISVGICNGETMLDLDYSEDSNAEADLNVVTNEVGGFVEIQGTAEGHAFQRNELEAMLDLALAGTREIVRLQRDALER